MILFSCNVLAKDSNDGLFDFLIKLEQSEKMTNIVKTEFVQTIFFEDTGEKQKINGTVFLKKPDSIYITQRTPQEQRIYINAKTIIIYTPDEKQAIVDSWKNSFDKDFSPADIINFGRSWRGLKKDYEIFLDGYDNNHVIIKIQGLKNKDFYVKMYFSKLNMHPEKAIVNSPGLNMEIVLKNYIINPTVSLDTFKFKSPNDVEVIKL
ncbi:MAG: outer membrane lipoprotein carrier protein LolA [Endomicrobium sp.]|jgi:outer membrane lipoprotein-sorting protein|nr:outer membrane lipoprotein carrier protein LolA [Endomicrobium sp.]